GGASWDQVVVRPFYGGAPRRNNVMGVVVVGRLIDARAANDLGRITSSDVVFRYGGEVAVSTLPALKEAEVGSQFHGPLTAARVYLGGEPYYSSAVELTPGLQPAAALI